jgi:uncharacterized membrane protein YkvA (DUF1232 family)
MATRTCPACGRPQGTSAECLSCREAAAGALAREARDVTPDAAGEHASAAGRFLERLPWYAKAAPGGLAEKLRLLWMVVRDYGNGTYRRVPWKAVAAVTAAIVYVVSPVDLVPDFLIPVGWTDDLVALAVTWRLVKRELRDYCAWKGLSPAHFGL